MNQIFVLLFPEEEIVTTGLFLYSSSMSDNAFNFVICLILGKLNDSKLLFMAVCTKEGERNFYQTVQICS